MNMETQTNSARQGFPIKFLTIAALVTAATLAGLSWNIYSSYRSIDQMLRQGLKIEELRGVIMHLDEVLTMSARMAAATGDLQWEKRYRVFEPQLDSAIKAAMAMTPDTTRDESSAQTDAANIALVEMENKSFDLVREGRQKQARDVLFSQAYETQKKIYAEGMAKFSGQLKGLVQAALESEGKRIAFQISTVVSVIPVLLVCWGIVWRSMRQWERSLKESNSRLERLNEELDHRVAERTEELSKEIAERKKLEGKMLQTAKMSAVGQLAAGVAHEINNPLGVILGFAQGLVSRLKPSDSLEMPLKSIEREATRCKNLVQDLLTFSRTSRMEREPVELKHVVQGALSLIEAQAKVKNVKVHSGLAENLPRVLANRNQLEQVILNLASNAIDAMPQGGTLSVKTSLLEERPMSWVCLRIQDTGSGIPQEVLPRIFEPFFTTKVVGHGTGLGLSLVYEIISKHSGTIDVQSRPGHTEFCVKLPVWTGREREIPASEGEHAKR